MEKTGFVLSYNLKNSSKDNPHFDPISEPENKVETVIPAVGDIENFNGPFLLTTSCNKASDDFERPASFQSKINDHHSHNDRQRAPCFSVKLLLTHKILIHILQVEKQSIINSICLEKSARGGVEGTEVKPWIRNGGENV